MITPMDVSSDFTESRLAEIATLLANVRSEVVDLHNDELGDTNRSLGYRAYECCCTQLFRLSQRLDWLKILTSGGRFTFSIGHTPVRFWKGEPDRLPSGKLIRSPEAMMQMELFPSEGMADNLIWYFVLNTDHNKLVDRAFFVGYSEQNEVVVNWEIPMTSKVTLMTNIDDNLPASVELNSAVAKIRLKKKIQKVVDNE